MTSDLTLLLIRLGYLALLWIFVLAVVSVIRADLFGAQIDSPRERGSRRTKTPKTKRRKGDPSLVLVVDGPGKGQQASLEEAPLLIGRGSGAAIRLDDDYVSTRHAQIAFSGDQWYVEDLGSTNGTYIGNHRLTEPTVVQAGSKVRVGKTTLELRK